jgi:hypothetical protein
MMAAWFKKVFVKLYVALDKTQRKRASEIIKQHGHLIPKRDENFGEQKKTLLPSQSDYESHQFWA